MTRFSLERAHQHVGTIPCKGAERPGEIPSDRTTRVRRARHRILTPAPVRPPSRTGLAFELLGPTTILRSHRCVGSEIDRLAARSCSPAEWCPAVQPLDTNSTSVHPRRPVPGQAWARWSSWSNPPRATVTRATRRPSSRSAVATSRPAGSPEWCRSARPRVDVVETTGTPDSTPDGRSASFVVTRGSSPASAVVRAGAAVRRGGGRSSNVLRSPQIPTGLIRPGGQLVPSVGVGFTWNVEKRATRVGECFT